jgi:hypothetical protein
MISWTSSLVTKLSALTSSVFNLFSNENVKNTLFQNVSKLRDITGELAAVSVDHDMTPKEREETKAMVEEERRKEENRHP